MNNYHQLANHIIAMQDDSYLSGHPEWHEIVKEAKNAVASEKRNYRIALLKDNQDNYDNGFIDTTTYETRKEIINQMHKTP